MKVRFYRGPWDGKVREVDPSESAIKVATTPKVTRENWNDWATMLPTTHIYYRTNYVHPDGSVFFEWGQPRRKRTK